MFTGCLLVLLATVSADTNLGQMYGKEGDEVSLKPNVTGPITSIVWKHGANLALEWDGSQIDAYRHFRERGQLNTLTGVMTISGLMRNDSGEYTAEINNIMAPSVNLIVISGVPVPTVSKSCKDDAGTCELSCDGNTDGAEPVSYTWKADDQVVPRSSERIYVIKEDSSSVKAFTCELQNPVSTMTSRPFINLDPSPTLEEGGGLKISTGVTVFICLLLPLLLLVFFHKWKTGIWFYEKGSMPWEADFWRRDNRPPSNTADANGTATVQVQGESDEETPMK